MTTLSELLLPVLGARRALFLLLQGISVKSIGCSIFLRLQLRLHSSLTVLTVGPSRFGCRLSIKLLLVCIFLSVASPAEVFTVPSLTGNSVQATINAAHAAGSNNTVSLPAGMYDIQMPLNLPCDNNLTVTGPITQPATAVLTADFTNDHILNMSGCLGVTIEYLGFANTGGVYLRSSNASNININHNTFFNLPSSIGGESQSSAAVYLDGNINTTVTNFSATSNTFGDANSCTAVFATQVDEGGYCAGIYAQAGTLVNPLVQYNVFNHVEEGIHYHQFCDGCPSGSKISVTQNSNIQFNYFVNWHRIAIEMQAAQVGTGRVISDNELQQPLNPSYGTMFISDACCTSGETYLTSSPPNPANVTEDNLLWTDQPQEAQGYWAPVIGIEFWGGAGSRANNNTVMGNLSNQITWGFGQVPLYVENNYLCAAHNGSYITQQQTSAAPTISGNTEAQTCTQQVSIAPTISPASGVYGSPPTITLSDAGRNTSIYYTTDGSTPVPGSGTTQLYTGPLIATFPSTVNAVGMWGVPPQPTTYPAPYGFVPSPVTTATYTGSSSPVLTSIYITSAGNASTVKVGSTLQFAAYGVFSDGSIQKLPDTQGDKVTLWNTSNHAVAKVSSLGHVTAISAGTVTIMAYVNSLAAPALKITVGDQTPSQLASIYIAGTGNSTSIKTGGTLQFTAYGVYSDGSVFTLPDSQGDQITLWDTTNHAVAEVNALGNVTAVSAGTANILAYVNSIAAPPLAITVGENVSPQLASIYVTATGNSTTIKMGGTLQYTAHAVYSDGSVYTLPDSQGDRVTLWNTSNHAVAKVSSLGHVTAISAGTVNVTAYVNSVAAQPLAVTVTAAP